MSLIILFFPDSGCFSLILHASLLSLWLFLLPSPSVIWKKRPCCGHSRSSLLQQHTPPACRLSQSQPRFLFRPPGDWLLLQRTERAKCSLTLPVDSVTDNPSGGYLLVCVCVWKVFPCVNIATAANS